MISIALLAIIFGLLFFMPFITRRKFGILGLALCAGYLLSEIYTNTLTPIIESQGIELSYLPLGVVVQVLLIMLPPIILLFGGGSYGVVWQRAAGSLAFAVLGFCLILEPITTTFQLDSTGNLIVAGFSSYSGIIIGVCIALAVLDVLLSKQPPQKKHGH